MGKGSRGVYSPIYRVAELERMSRQPECAPAARDRKRTVTCSCFPAGTIVRVARSFVSDVGVALRFPIHEIHFFKT